MAHSGTMEDLVWVKTRLPKATFIELAKQAKSNERSVAAHVRFILTERFALDWIEASALGASPKAFMPGLAERDSQVAVADGQAPRLSPPGSVRSRSAKPRTQMCEHRIAATAYCSICDG